MIQIVKKGKVILAGAGPGDPDLISLKALKYLQTADVILTDRLVSPNLIEEYARKDAEVIYVGKQCSKGIWTPQKDINELMVEFALQDKLVLRLKGGDASLFSNVLDELHAVKNNNIPYEIIPGISAAFGALDLAEDRGRFSELLTELNIPFPRFGVAENAEEAVKLADTLDFPLLVRPSYVLGGQGMKIVINKQELEEHVIEILKHIPNNKLLLDHYLDGAIEAEADAICDADGNVYIIGIMEHIEPCGVHSGDSNATLPPFNLGEFVMQQIKDHTKKIATALKTVGLINIQFAIKDDTVYIIEANPRASRTVPFIAKAYGEPYVNYATKVMLGHNKVTDFDFNPQLKGYAIKQPVFSFSKFPNVNKALGPEMKSTGESILFIDDLKDDQFYDLYARRKMYLTK
jgi:carbamoylphosphate synthase large subunit